MESLGRILSTRRYFAPTWVFASLNIMTGTWVLYLPYIKEKFVLNDAQVGVALFFTALGLLLSIPFVPFFNQKFGVGRSTQVGVVLFALVFNLPLLAPDYMSLCASLLLTGLFSGFTDVSMNALVSTIEQSEDTPFMSAAHGFFSIGGFIGAGIGSLLLGYFSNPVWHMVLISVLIILSNLFLSISYVGIREASVTKTEKEEGNSFFVFRLLFGLSIVAFIVMFNEGAVEHWSSLFFHDILSVEENKAGLGFIAFSLFMTLGRFLGDGFSQRYGAIRIIGFGCLTAFVGYFFILSSQVYVAVLGFGILGLGLSVIIPELFRLAGKTKGVNASVGISVVSGIGYLGFLSGPVLLGLIAYWSSLVGSFVFLTASIVLALVLNWVSLKRMYDAN